MLEDRSLDLDHFWALWKVVLAESDLFGASHNLANLPGLLAVEFEQVFLVLFGALSWKHDEETSTCLSRVACEEFEVKDVSVYSVHSLDDWDSVNPEVDICLLSRHKVLGVTSNSETGDVGSAMSLVLLH